MSISDIDEEKEIEVVLEVQSVPSTPDPPLEEWSSFLIKIQEENVKRTLYANNLYDPGSGEICGKYIAQSASSVVRHPYYKYPAVLDPGIEKALFDPPHRIIYEVDGKDLYLAICKEMNQCPVRLFYSSLMENTIDLSYYCVNPWGVRAMTKALELNPHVVIFNLTQNFLNDDACFHLGELLTKNITLRELNLSGCRIGPSGLRRILAGLLDNYTLTTLNLNSNDLDDVGGVILAEAFQKGLRIKDLYLSYNNLGSNTARAIAEGIEFNNKLKKLDLSWNNLHTPEGTTILLSRMRENNDLEWLNLSWNAIGGHEFANALKKLLLAPNLSYLNLMNNKIDDTFVRAISNALPRAKKLITLDLSNNPITSRGATMLVSKFKFKSIKICNLILENIAVGDDFVCELANIKGLKMRGNLTVTTGPYIKPFKAVGRDMRDLILNRIVFLCLKPKRNKLDFALFCLQLAKDYGNNISIKMLLYLLKNNNAGAVDADLITQLANYFPGPIVNKEKTIDLVKLVEFNKRKWPDTKLPPTPPPEPPPPEPVRKKDAKGKKTGPKNK